MQYMTILTHISMPFTNHILKDLQTFHAVKIDNVKRMYAVEVPKSQINKKFPIDDRHPLNKWYTDSVKERAEMLNNHDIWGIMGVGIMSATTIIHLPTVVINYKGETVIRYYLGLSLGTKLKV